ncbi:hypothetical protein DUZ99_08090 [Xylanibacillus composti]|nr:hypothetical protein [Xylanibacillus composti]
MTASSGFTFEWDERLGIRLPVLEREFDAFLPEEQEAILGEWEQIRGSIPDRIRELEQRINLKQDELGKELDFARSCRLNSEIAELASRINDLQIWYRVNQELDGGKTGKSHQ